MKTPTIRHASLVVLLAVAALTAACTQPSGGGASGAPDPAASTPGSADPAASASPYDYGGSESGAPADSGEYVDKNDDEYAAP